MKLIGLEDTEVRALHFKVSCNLYRFEDSIQSLSPSKFSVLNLLLIFLIF